MLKAKIKTKSNYRQLNGDWIEVSEIKGNRVTCLVPIEGKMVACDFTTKEVDEFEYEK